MVRYFKLNKDSSVICELIAERVIRLSKWKWDKDVCYEEYKYKELSPSFFDSFSEISKRDFNNIWGNKLEKA